MQLIKTELRQNDIDGLQYYKIAVETKQGAWTITPDTDGWILKVSGTIESA